MSTQVSKDGLTERSSLGGGAASADLVVRAGGYALEIATCRAARPCGKSAGRKWAQRGCLEAQGHHSVTLWLDSACVEYSYSPEMNLFPEGEMELGRWFPVSTSNSSQLPLTSGTEFSVLNTQHLWAGMCFHVCSPNQGTDHLTTAYKWLESFPVSVWFFKLSIRPLCYGKQLLENVSLTVNAMGKFKTQL